MILPLADFAKVITNSAIYVEPLSDTTSRYRSKAFVLFEQQVSKSAKKGQKT
jgi:hypothetical protein